jgi:hypothetical protein
LSLMFLIRVVWSNVLMVCSLDRYTLNVRTTGALHLDSKQAGVGGLHRRKI